MKRRSIYLIAAIFFAVLSLQRESSSFLPRRRRRWQRLPNPKWRWDSRA